MAKKVMLTTNDNPFNPFNDFNSWFSYDVENGYNSCGMLMRIADVTDDMSSEEYYDAIEKAIDKIIMYDFVGVYKKISYTEEDTN